MAHIEEFLHIPVQTSSPEARPLSQVPAHAFAASVSPARSVMGNGGTPQAHIGLGFIGCRLGGVLDICFPEPLFFPCLSRHSPYASVRNRAERVWECRNTPWVPGERGERQDFFLPLSPTLSRKKSSLSSCPG